MRSMSGRKRLRSEWAVPVGRDDDECMETESFSQDAWTRQTPRRPKECVQLAHDGSAQLRNLLNRPVCACHIRKAVPRQEETVQTPLRVRAPRWVLGISLPREVLS